MQKLKKLFSSSESSGKDPFEIPPGPPARKAVLKTSLGEITFELFPESAPMAVHNFSLLSTLHKYDACPIHRLIPHFMFQTGDYTTGSGLGGKSAFPRHKKFPNEIDLPRRSHDRAGVLSMANTGGDRSNGSQFFVTLGPCRHLDGKHTVFGQVVQGMEVVEGIGRVGTGELERPVEEIWVVEARAWTGEGGEYGSGGGGAA